MLATFRPLLILAALLSACGGDTHRDTINRQILQVSTETPLDPSAFSVGVPDLALQGTVPRFTRREVDNGAVRFDTMTVTGRGVLTVQYAPETWFSQGFEQRMGDRGSFLAWVNEVLVAPPDAKQTSDGQINAVTHAQYRTIGFTHMRRESAGARGCFAGRAAYRVKGRTIFDNDYGEPDLTMEAAYFGSIGDIQAFARLFEQVAVRR